MTNESYQQSYTKSTEKEKRNRPRDLKNLNIVIANYVTEEILNKPMQVYGIDVIAAPEKITSYNPYEILYVDIKTTDKDYRQLFVFELYEQPVSFKKRYKSWSYRIKTINSLQKNFYIAFTDGKKVTMIQSINMLPVLEEIENNRPDMIKRYLEKSKDEDKEDKWKWIIELEQNSPYFKAMKPALFKIENEKVTDAIRYDNPRTNNKLVFPKKRRNNKYYYPVKR